MKTLDPTLLAHMKGKVTTLTHLLKMTREVDGTVFSFTSFQKDIAFDDGAGVLTYSAIAGAGASAQKREEGITPSTIEIQMIQNLNAFDQAEIEAGLWDEVRYQIYEVNYRDLTAGRMRIVQAGRLADLQAVNGVCSFLLESRLDGYKAQTGRQVQEGCDYSFGDLATCGVLGVQQQPALWSASTAVTQRLSADAKTGSVVRPSVFNDRYFEAQNDGTTGVTEPTWDTTLGNLTNDNGVSWKAIQANVIEATFAANGSGDTFQVTASTDAPDDRLRDGFVVITSGANAAQRLQIRTWDLASKTIELKFPLPFAWTAGDSLELRVACHLTVAECNAFDNFLNYPGHPFLPKRDQRLRIRRA